MQEWASNQTGLTLGFNYGETFPFSFFALRRQNDKA